MVKETVYDAVFDAQQHFRVLLQAMSRPGSIYQIDEVDVTPPEGLHRASALVGFALLNGDVCFHVAQGDKDISNYLMVNTSSQWTSADVADFIFLQGYQRSPVVLSAKLGSLRYPEEGATLIVDVDKISESAFDGALALTLSGPGIADTQTLHVRGLDEALLADFASRNGEFPLGIDMIVVDGHDVISCIPRTAKLHW